jgi:hypothetical protein
MESGAAVVGREGDPRPECSKFPNEQQLGLAAGAEQNLQPVRPFEPAGEEEQRRGSDSAAAEQDILVVQLRRGPAQWAEHVEFVACARAAEQSGPAPDHAEHEPHSIPFDLADRNRSSQQRIKPV